MAAKVAVAGATGNLGLPVVKQLLAADYAVTVLSRAGSGSASKLPQHANLSVAEVDYSSVSSLTETLRGHLAVVSTLATASIGGQKTLIDAALAAGVTRFIPSEFGSDTTHPKSAQLPVYKYKVETQDYLKEVATKQPAGGRFSYTLVINGAFLDWGVRVGFLVNPANHTATLYNGGDVRFSATTLDAIGQAVVGVVRHLPETANRAVYVHSAAVTQNQLIGYVQEKDGQDWTTTTKDTEKVKEESFAELAKGPGADVGTAMVGFLSSAIFNPSYGPDFSDHLDNELLGVKELTEAELRQEIQSFVDKERL